MREENGGKMTRYGACLILERGEVLIPEGLQQGMSQQQFFFLFVSHCLSKLWHRNINFTVFGHSGISAAPTGANSLGVHGDGWISRP